jgi:hypothetical protein
MTAARFLELFFAQGGDSYVRPDAKLVLRAPQIVLDAVMPKIKMIGRDAIAREITRQDVESHERVLKVLGRFRRDSSSSGWRIVDDQHHCSAAAVTIAEATRENPDERRILNYDGARQ